MTSGKSLVYKPGSGINRNYWAIKQWLEKENISLTDIARSLGLTVGLISHTIRGVKNNRRVLNHLCLLGCPIIFLSLPKDMQK